MSESLERQLAEACVKLNFLKEKKKDVNAEYGRRIKDLEQEIKDLSAQLTGGVQDDEEEIEFSEDSEAEVSSLEPTEP